MAETPQNKSTGQGPGNPAPKSDDGVAPTPTPIPDLKAAEVFAESLKNANRRLSELGEEGRETADALQSINMMRGKLNAAMKDEIESKNELIKKHEERVKAEERLSTVQRELTEIDEKYAKFRKEDGTLTHAAQKLYLQDTRKLKEEMLRLNLTVARTTTAHREAEEAHSKAVQTANKWSENFKANMQAIRGMPGVGKIVTDWLDQLEKSFKEASETQTEAAAEGLSRMESIVEKYSRARLEAELEGEEEEQEAQRKASLRRMKSRMEDAAGTAAREVAATGGVVGVSEIFAAQSVMGDLTETFKKYLGRQASGEQLEQFNAVAKMIQTLGKGAVIDENTAAVLGQRIERVIGTPLTQDMTDLLKKSLEETKKQRESGEIGQAQVVIAMGANNDVIDSLQKTITDNTTETINILKQEEVNKLIQQGIKADQARAIVERRAQIKGSELQIAIAKEQKKSLEALTTATNANGDRTIDTLLLNLDQMNDNQRASIEATVEERFIVPKWAGALIGAYNNSVGVWKEEFGRLSDLFDGSTGFTKMLMIAAFIIGAVVGYIWTYIQKVYTIISTGFNFVTKSFKAVFGSIEFIKRLFSGTGGMFAPVINMFKNIGSMLGGAFGSVGQFISRAFGPILNIFRGAGSGLTAIGNAIPMFGKIFGFLPKIMGAFQLGFRWASVLFPPLFAIINIITAIVGAFRGFGQGGIKGAIIGVIAQLLSGLTFGIMDFQKMFDFLNSTLGPLFDAIIDLAMFAYNTMIKPFVDMFKNIFAIWTGGGGIFTKLAKTIFEVGIAALKFAVGRFLMFFVQLPVFLMKGVFYVLKFFFYDIPKMIVDGIAWFWNWITSGDWLSDINNFGSWMLGKLQEFWDWVLNSVADAIESLPWIGPKIAKGMRPSKDADTKVIEDSVSKPLKKAVEMSSVQRSSAAQAQAAFAGNQTNYATYKPTGTQPQIVANAGRVVTPSGVPIQSPMATSVTTVEAARMQAQAAARQPPTTATVQVNNSQVSAGGGGGTPLIPLGPNRNPDPTYRALLFMEAPAL